jgi:hypothetical protein
MTRIISVCFGVISVSSAFRGLSRLALFLGWSIGLMICVAQSSDESRKHKDFPQINIKEDCGAKGDGKTNDTAAFQEASRKIQKAGGGTLIIPPGTYLVGKQEHVPGQFPYFRAAPIFSVSGLKFLRIEGRQAKLRLAAGLRFGSFDKDNGEPYYPPKMPFVDPRYAAVVGTMLDVAGCDNVVIRDLELDGNVSELVIGGQFGDTGWQLPASGIFIRNCKNVTIERTYSHHHALDGIMIGWYGLKEQDPAAPHTLTDCVFEYNGRQGLSWIGGRGLTVRRCKFNHTGRAQNGGKPFGSAPGAGLDIEAEESICRDGYFEDCEFINNAGCGMVADSGDGGYSRFVRCLFWGTTNWSAWNAKPGLVFEDCVFHGSVVHAVGSDSPDKATRWIRCKFEDKPWQGQKPYGSFLAEINGNLANVRFEACTFTANDRRSIWCNGKGAVFADCSVTHKASGINPNDFQCLIRGAKLVGCRFREEFSSDTKATWFIVVDGTEVAEGKETTVDGPHVRWGHPGGPVGKIPPTQSNRK